MKNDHADFCILYTYAFSAKMIINRISTNVSFTF